MEFHVVGSTPHDGSGTVAVSDRVSSFEEAYYVASEMFPKFDRVEIVFHIYGFVTPFEFSVFTRSENYVPPHYPK